MDVCCCWVGADGVYLSESRTYNPLHQLLQLLTLPPLQLRLEVPKVRWRSRWHKHKTKQGKALRSGHLSRRPPVVVDKGRSKTRSLKTVRRARKGATVASRACRICCCGRCCFGKRAAGIFLYLLYSGGQAPLHRCLVELLVVRTRSAEFYCTFSSAYTYNLLQVVLKPESDTGERLHRAISPVVPFVQKDAFHLPKTRKYDGVHPMCNV